MFEGFCILLGVPSENKRLRTVFLLDEENALLHSFNTSMDAQAHLALDVYAKVTRSPLIKDNDSIMPYPSIDPK